MKKCLIACLLPFAALVTQAGEWQSIFDGTSLTGWKSNEEVPGCFTVVDGALRVSGGRAHIFYDGPVGGHDFKNFEFRAKVKTEPGANSGIYFHTVFEEKGWPSKGYECQVNNTHKDPRKTASLYAVSDVMNDAPAKDHEWFDYHIKVEGKHIVISINGEVKTDWTEPEGWEPPKGMAGRRLGSGTLAFQGHDPKSTVHYKDIALRILPD